MSVRFSLENPNICLLHPWNPKLCLYCRGVYRDNCTYICLYLHIFIYTYISLYIYTYICINIQDSDYKQCMYVYTYKHAEFFAVTEIKTSSQYMYLIHLNFEYFQAVFFYFLTVSYIQSNTFIFQNHTSELKAWTEEILCGDLMVLALISTACISNVIYSLQAMLIYARISNSKEAEDGGIYI